MTVPVAMVAGEASGDLLAGLLLVGLKKRVPQLAPYGIGGPRMVEQGFRADWPIAKLAVRGYVEVLRHYFEIAGIRKTLKRRLLDEPPAAFIGIDAPDFNLDLEIALREAWRGRGRPVVHFIGPSIWAWRGKRIEKIARAVDHILVLFPFEEALYRKAGIAATYVGHPLADVIPLEPDRQAARRALDLPDAGRIVALMPGSRLSEVHYMARTFIDAAALLHRRHADVQFVVPMASREARNTFEAILRGTADDLPLTIVDGQSHEVLAAADAVLVASGTATLETALFKRPMVIAYKMAGLSAMIMRRMGYLPWVGLPNILARELLVPEFLQEAATPEALAHALDYQLSDDHNRRRLEQRFLDMHHDLRCNTGERAAAVIAELLERPGARL
jgi:lipid-A-disaccharide synthase